MKVNIKGFDRDTKLQKYDFSNILNIYPMVRQKNKAESVKCQTKNIKYCLNFSLSN